MTEMLDPYEVQVEDEGDFDLGPACSLDGEECEACQ